MRIFPLGFLAISLLLGLSIAAAGQVSKQAPAHPSVPWKQYCQPDGGFCVKYPSTWSILGEVFGGEGIVIAPEQKQDRSLWDEVTAGLIVPPPKGDADPVNIDQMLEQTMASLREGGQSVETLQRQERTVGGYPAQLLKVRYQERPSDHDWIEELVFIAGPDSEIYSVALKCSPESLTRLEPVLAGMLQSWKLPKPEPPAAEPSSSPKS